MPSLQHMGGLLHLKHMHGQGTHRIDLQVQTLTGWRRPAPGSMLRWTLLRKGTMKASLWGLNSTALLNLHARLQRNQRLPVLSVKMLTRGEHDDHTYACALNVYMFPTTLGVQEIQHLLGSSAGQKKPLTTERKLRRLSSDSQKPRPS